MADCRAIEPLLAGYVDGDVAAGAHLSVEAHLAACAVCRMRVDCERAARELLQRRRAALTPCASAALRARCASCACGRGLRLSGMFRADGLTRRTMLPLSLAATVLLAVTAVFLLSGDSVEVLAAQLAVDHVKCFHLPSFHGPVDAAAAAEAWSQTSGWAIKVPRSAPADDLELVDVRRCLSTHGFTAHIMYKWRGTPLSLYVLNSGSASHSAVERLVSSLGQEAVVWSEGDRTYAVIGQGRPADLERIAHQVGTAAR